MIRSLVAALTLLAAGDALAQSTSTCQWIGTVYQCNHNQAPSVDWSLGVSKTNPGQEFIQSYEAARLRKRQELAQQEALRASRAAEMEAAHQTARRNVVSRLLADGNCESAVSFALSAGDIPLAKEAREFCKP